MTIRTQSYEKRIDQLLKIATAVKDDEVKALLSNYICVLVSGYIETSIQDIISEYTKPRSHGSVSGFVVGRLKRFTNANTEKIGNMLNNFNQDWKSSFDSMLTEERRSAINSIVANRNLIAHGISTSISLRNVSEYYVRCKDVINEIESKIIK